MQRTEAKISLYDRKKIERKKILNKSKRKRKKYKALKKVLKCGDTSAVKKING